jgi:phage replication initiation protein
VKTSIDWFKFRSKRGPFELLELVRPAFGSVGELLEIKTGSKPRDGWTHAADICLPDEVVAHIDYGGDSQRDWVRFDMSGTGCGWVQNWDHFVTFDQFTDFEVTRLDIAFTTSDPSVVCDSKVVEAFEAGKFRCGGRPPAMNSIVSSDACAGKTRYIGKRENHKYLRCYEKGWEMMKDLPDFAAFLRKPGVQVCVDTLGHVAVQDLYRVELELKNVDKYIPFLAIAKRDEVFAGAYPFCADLLPDAPHMVMSELPSFKPRAALLKALGNAFRSYGGTWKAAHLAYGGDDVALLRLAKQMLADEPSRHLVESGVLTVDHEPIF